MRAEHPNFYVETQRERLKKEIGTISSDLLALFAWSQGWPPEMQPEEVRKYLLRQNDERAEAQLTPEY